LNSISFAGLTGKIITPECPAYNKSRQIWNRAIQKFPYAIVYCHNKYDVSNAIIWSQRYDIPLRIRSGGHNYEGYSTDNAVIVIDLSEMNMLTLDEEKNQLTVQGGVNNKQLYDYISSRGYPFPGGTCPTVCVSGYALGGGWGLSCRYLGLGCDSLVELELVDYKGMFITANNEHNSDLFWACKGAGGGNFGVVVSMTFKLPPKVGKVTFVEIYYPNASQEKQALFLKTWQEWLNEAGNNITLIASIYNSPDEGLAIYSRGIFYGTPKEAREVMQPFIDLGDAELNLEYLSFLETITKIGESYPDSQMFKSTGRFVLRRYRAYEISNIIGLIQQRPMGSVYAAITLYALGGKVAEKGRRDTAFFYRDANYIMSIQSVWENREYAQDNIDWVNRKFRYLESVTEGSYVNFPYSDLVDYLEEYYGLNADRLRVIKERYDPYNVFIFPQSIDRFAD